MFKRKDAVIIQHASDVTQPMLALTMPFHTQYCLNHGFDYWPIFGCTMPESTGKAGVWEKTYLIRLALEAGYKYVIFLDCDTLIVTNDDLRDGCPEDAIGCTWHAADWSELNKDLPEDGKIYDHHNIGTLFLTNCDPVRMFVELWWKTDPGNHCWSNQHAFMLACEEWKKKWEEDDEWRSSFRATFDLPVKTIDHRWNSTVPHFVSDNPAVMAWHGYGESLQERFDVMVAEVRKRFNNPTGQQAIVADLSAKSIEEAWTKARGFIERQDWENAARMLQGILSQDADNPALWKEYANCIINMKMHAQAVPLLKQCLAFDPQNGECWRMLSGCYTYLGEHEESGRAIRNAIKWSDGAPGAHVNLALYLLKDGKWEEGFRELEYDYLQGGRKRRVITPEWNGEYVDDLFVNAEQGLGDTLTLACLLPVLLEKNLCKRIVWEVQPPLVSLLTNQIPGVEVVKELPDRSTPFEYEANIGMFSLPRVLCLQPERLKIRRDAKPFQIGAATHKAQAWAERMSKHTPKFKVGFQWQGNPTHGNDFQRSVPAELFDNLVLIPGAMYYCLQRDLNVDVQTMARIVEETPTVEFIGHELNDMSDTAAVLANLDLVITVDTALLHLAGCMNIPTWGMISRASDWRWLTEEHEDTVWYRSVKLYRQKVLGDWEEVMQRIERDLSAKVNPSSAFAGKFFCPHCQTPNKRERTHCGKCKKSLHPVIEGVTV